MEKQITNGVLVISNEEKYDIGNAETVTGELTKEIENNTEIKALQFDFANTSFVSTAGLRMLSAINKTCIENGLNFSIVNVKDEIYEVMELTGYTSAFNVEKVNI